MLDSKRRIHCGSAKPSLVTVFNNMEMFLYRCFRPVINHEYELLSSFNLRLQAPTLVMASWESAPHIRALVGDAASDAAHAQQRVPAKVGVRNSCVVCLGT